MRLEKSPRNPIFPRDPAGAWRQDLTADPVVMRVGNEYRLYFRGRRHAEDQYNAQHLIGGTAIGLFTCPADQFDGETWTEYPHNPVIRPGQVGEFDDLGHFAGEIIHAGGQYLFYTTACSHQWTIDIDKGIGRGGKTLGLFKSSDGLAFERVGDKPLISSSSGAGVAVFFEGRYHLFYNRGRADGHHDLVVARSEDPFVFDDASAEVALVPGVAGAWDSRQVQNPRVFFDQGVWYMVYGGTSRFADNPHHFGVAASYDLHTWTRYSGNPILARGREGEWDDCGIWPGAVVRHGDTYYLFYEGRCCGEPQAQADARVTGRGRLGYSQIGLAKMRSDTFFFRP